MLGLGGGLCSLSAFLFLYLAKLQDRKVFTGLLPPVGGARWRQPAREKSERGRLTLLEAVLTTADWELLQLENESIQGVVYFA